MNLTEIRARLPGLAKKSQRRTAWARLRLAQGGKQLNKLKKIQNTVFLVFLPTCTPENFRCRRPVDKSTSQSSQADFQIFRYLTLHQNMRVNSMIKEKNMKDSDTHSLLCPITTVWYEVGGSLQYLVHWFFFFFLENCTSIYTWQAYTFISLICDNTHTPNTQIPKHTLIRSGKSAWQQQYPTEQLDPLASESWGEGSSRIFVAREDTYTSMNRFTLTCVQLQSIFLFFFPCL